MQAMSIPWAITFESSSCVITVAPHHMWNPPWTESLGTRVDEGCWSIEGRLSSLVPPFHPCTPANHVAITMEISDLKYTSLNLSCCYHHGNLRLEKYAYQELQLTSTPRQSSLLVIELISTTLWEPNSCGLVITSKLIIVSFRGLL